MYGLLGKKLEHSFSKPIHGLFGDNNYNLYEYESIEKFLKTVNFKGINVTIPYKTKIIDFLDELDPISKQINSVNTVIKKGKKLIGYNTDYYGLKSSLAYQGIEVNDKNILILGNGSVSNTIELLVKNLGAKKIVKLCRNIKKENEFLLNAYNNFLDYEVIINSTPVGMYPNNNDDLLIDLSKFIQLEAIIDLVYNPFNTKLILAAKKLNIKTINGLYMLVMQAKKAYELFHNVNIPLEKANNIYKKFYYNYINYVFIGLPLSGKTKYANILGEILSKNIIDIDQLIETKQNQSIPDIFAKEGEEVFRNLENKVVLSIYKKHRLAISTGGGLVENDFNMNLLKQNGIIIFLNKDPNIIAQKKIYGRPLLKDSNNIYALAKKRIPLYEKYSDIIIDIKKDTNFHVNEIKEKVNEYINH